MLRSDSFDYVKRIGTKTSELFKQLGQLRIEVFRDFPYLYEGDVDYEMDYLRTYSESERSMVFAVFDGEKMVGATTCIPLQDESEEVILPFRENGYDIKNIFYFGESLLLKPYRGMGIGHRFFDEREKHAASFGNFTHACFCSVKRPDDHPLKPADYKSNDVFWDKRGYKVVPELVSEFEWKDIGEQNSSKKPMVFWMKSL